MKNPLYFKFITAAVITLITTAVVACKKEQDARLVVANATVINKGDFAADGCGWMLKVDTTFYSPKNLPEKFKIADAKVTVGYYLLDTKFQCGLSANSKYSEVEIKDIKNR